MTNPSLVDLVVREEVAADFERIDEVNCLAFPTDAEARLVRLLREQARPFVSLVAIDASAVVGHIAFSPVRLASKEPIFVMGLGPMSVVPERQRRGVGGRLVEAGIHECRRLGVQALVVLGHIDYYPKFGFLPASRWDVKCEYDVPDEAFMLLELEAGCVPPDAKLARYHEAFGAVA